MANKSYRVLSGSFRKPNDELVEVGGTIELPADVAERFRNQLSEVSTADSTKKASPAKADGDV
ncbi:hypothetical protein [Pseudomonas umsongensis]|uniref:hypothetical protein n=1 Tax=Pseudomonas umsongensis TaxID=198618 RepID=UPI0015B914AA|nr:hypothetical protein [Pseudomonas umsongensis]NWL18641.1 hypothetical protein [Pseudomonas umsongensis]